MPLHPSIATLKTRTRQGGKPFGQLSRARAPSSRALPADVPNEQRAWDGLSSLSSRRPDGNQLADRVAGQAGQQASEGDREVPERRPLRVVQHPPLCRRKSKLRSQPLVTVCGANAEQPAGTISYADQPDAKKSREFTFPKGASSGSRPDDGKPARPRGAIAETLSCIALHRSDAGGRRG